MKTESIITLLVVWALCMVSCTKDAILPENGVTTNGVLTIEMHLGIGRESTIETRAESSEDNFGKSVYLLVYDGDGPESKLVEHKEATITGQGNRRRLTVELTASTEHRTIYVLANSSPGVQSALSDFPDAFQVGSTYSAAADAIVESQTVQDGVMSPIDAASIPRVATVDYPDGISNQTQMGTPQEPIFMNRSVAKISVVVDSGAPLILTGMSLYNAPTQGRVLAQEDPQIVTNNMKARYYTKLNGSDISGVVNGKKSSQLYVYEVSNSADNNGDKPLLVVVKGRFNGSFVDTYYSIAVRQEGAFLDFRRNTHYKVNITSIGVKGYASAEEALKYPSSNIVSDIIVEDDLVNFVSSNGQYMLGTEIDRITIKTMAETKIGKIFTDNGPTPTISVSSGLKIIKNITGKSSVPTISAAQEIDFTDGRDETVTITSGNLTRTIAVALRPLRYVERGSAIIRVENDDNKYAIQPSFPYIGYITNTSTSGAILAGIWELRDNNVYASRRFTVSSTLNTSDNNGSLAQGDSGKTACANLAEKGGGWRMPTIIELQLIDKAQSQLSPIGHPALTQEMHMSATYSGHNGLSMAIERSGGQNFLTAVSNTILYRIRCVRDYNASAPQFATGNITLSPDGATLAIGSATEYGLYFKHGSVVAVRSKDNNSTFDAKEDIVWSPKTTADAIDKWTDIPSRASHNGHTLGNIMTGIGDPCRLVGLPLAGINDGTRIDNKTWRMPNEHEMIMLGGNSDYGKWATNSGVGGYQYSSLPVFLPAAGCRETSGSINGQGLQGYYLMAIDIDINKYEGSYALTFSHNNSRTGRDEQNKAKTIRCVRQ